MNSFTHLGSTAAIGGAILEDAYNHINKANKAFVKLYPDCRNKNILVRTNIQLANTIVKSVLLNGCEMRKITKWISNSLQMFINKCLSFILNVK